MHLFGKLYAHTLVWARHPHATRYLCVLSFVEAFVFPVMPEVMLAPMMLGKRHKAYFYANLSLASSLLGALVGYLLGHWAFEVMKPMLGALHLLAPIERGVQGLRLQMAQHRWGLFGVLLLAALQPVVPMKFVTWAAGIVGVPLLPFVGCVALGRGKRVWLLALLIRLVGERAEQLLHRYIEWIGWIVLALLGLLSAWWFWRH